MRTFIFNIKERSILVFGLKQKEIRKFLGFNFIYKQLTEKMRTPEERKKDSHSKYAHIFDGDFDYSRWDGKTHTWAEKRRERNKEYGRKRRSADFKRKHG